MCGWWQSWWWWWSYLIRVLMIIIATSHMKDIVKGGSSETSQCRWHVSSLKYVCQVFFNFFWHLSVNCLASNIFDDLQAYIQPSNIFDDLQAYIQPQIYLALFVKYSSTVCWHMSSLKYICKIFVIHVFANIWPAANVFINLQAIQPQICLELFVKCFSHICRQAYVQPQIYVKYLLHIYFQACVQPQIYWLICRHISGLKYICHYLSSDCHIFTEICPVLRYLSYICWHLSSLKYVYVYLSPDTIWSW